MSSIPHDHAADHGHGDEEHAHHPSGIMRWITTTNHKDIGTLYLWFSFIMFLTGGTLALTIRSELFHPGDSLTIPEDAVHTLLLPISAPWLKAGEMIDYFRAVAPARGYAIHDAILNENGLGLVTRLMNVAAAPSGAAVARLEPGASLDL